MSRGLRILTVMLLVAVASGTGSWWLGTRVTSAQEAAARAQPPAASPITAPVELRELRQLLVIPGTISGGEEIEVFVEPAVSDARVVVTKPALPPGTPVRAGDRLVEVSGRPVFVFAGPVPMYRDLRPGVEGDDVAALQQALRELDFDSWDEEGVFGDSTAAAVRRFYRAQEYDPVLEPVAVEEDPEQPAGTGEPATDQAQQPDQVVVPASEVVFLAQLPAVVTTVHAAVGQRPAGPVLTLSTGDLAARAPVTGSDQALLAIGDPATMRTATGAELAGTITAIEPPEQAPAEEAEPAGSAGNVLVVDTETALDPSLLGQEVTIAVEIASTGEPVLAVPLAAVWSTADKGTYVTVLGPQDQQVDLPVTPGLSADGFVELAEVDGELAEGDLVLVGQAPAP